MNKNSFEEAAIEAMLNIFVSVRSGELPSEEEFNGLLIMMNDIAEASKNDKYISKSLAEVLFDLSTALYSCMDIIDPEKKENAMIFFDNFCDAARNILCCENY